MDLNQDLLSGKWPGLKDRVKQQWGKLTDADVQQLNGTTAELAGVLRQRYGYGRAQAQMEINQWVASTTARPASLKEEQHV